MKKSKKFLSICKSLELNPDSIPQIMSVKDAFKHLKRKFVMPKFRDVPKEYREYYIADYSLVIITEAMNLQTDGTIWTPNYNENEDKYEPRFWVKADKKRPSGFGFSGTYFVGWGTVTAGGSRLCFKEYDRMRFVQAVHEKLYVKKMLILKKKR